MFSPDADESPYHPTSINAAVDDPKFIKYGNTRLPEYEAGPSGQSAPPSPTRSRIDAAIAGTPCRLILMLKEFASFVFYRPTEVTSAISYTDSSISDPFRTWTSCCKATHDLGDTQRHTSHYISNR